MNTTTITKTAPSRTSRRRNRLRLRRTRLPVVRRKAVPKRSTRITAPTRSSWFHPSPFGYDKAAIAWELSLRDPVNVRNVRVPAPYIAQSATCHFQQISTLAANASGNLLVMFDPLVDGTLGTSAVTVNCPFANGSGKPVADMEYRVVSAQCTIRPLAPLATQTGTITCCIVPQVPTVPTAWDDYRDQPSSIISSATNSQTVKWLPSDPNDITFDVNSAHESNTSLAFLVDAGLAAASYQFSIHINYEFLPTSGLDYFNTTYTPLGDPNARQAYSQLPTSTLVSMLGSNTSNPSTSTTLSSMATPVTVSNSNLYETYRDQSALASKANYFQNLGSTVGTSINKGSISVDDGSIVSSVKSLLPELAGMGLSALGMGALGGVGKGFSKLSGI